jgi:hypothetical protein
MGLHADGATDPYYLKFAQSHFVTRQGGLKLENVQMYRNPRSAKYALGRTNKFGLPRKYATKYLGWYQRAIEEAIKITQELNRELGVEKRIFSRSPTLSATKRPIGRHQQFKGALLDTCKRMKIKYSITRGVIRIKPPKPRSHQRR